MTADRLEKMRALWESSPELSAREIGERFGVSKNAVIGLAYRHGWTPRAVIRRSIASRRLVR